MQKYISVSGIPELKSKVKGIHPKLITAFGTLIKELRRDVKLKSPVVSHAFYREWNIPPPSGLTARIINKAPYAGAVVYGSELGQKPWPSPGKKTVSLGGRVWSNTMLGNPPNVGTYEQTVLDPDRIQNRFAVLAKQELAK